MKRPVNLWFALLGLGTSKLRSALTVLGIVIGVAAVIMIVSLGNGLQRSTAEQMEAFGGGTIEIRPSMNYAMREPMAVDYASEEAIKSMDAAMSRPMQQPTLHLDDVRALRELGTTLDGVTAVCSLNASIVHKGQEVPIWQIMAVSPEWLNVYQREVKSGRFLTSEDEASAASVAVIDEALAKDYFGDKGSPVGQTLHVAISATLAQDFTIIGVLSNDEEYGPTSNALVIPLSSGRLRLGGKSGDEIDSITVRVDSRDPQQRKIAVVEIATLLRARRVPAGGQDDFGVNDSLAYSEEMTRITDLMTLILSLIAGISLVVGSIGLMNIMLVAVGERTWEIGLRRAIGARRSDVMVQFLCEAILLSLAGGIIGMGLGMAGSYAVSYVVEQLTGHVHVTIDVIAIAMGVSTVVGVASGLYPAARASRLQPTQALRHVA